MELAKTKPLADLIKDLETKASVKLPDLKSKSTHTLLAYIEHLEQVEVHRHAKTWGVFLPKVDLRMSLAGQELIKRFESATGFAEAELTDAGVQWRMLDQVKWQRLLIHGTETRRCELLEMAYGVAISKISTASPTREYWGGDPIKTDSCLGLPLGCHGVWENVTPEDRATEEFKWDYQRSLWEMRYFSMLTPGILVSPNCPDPLFPKYTVAEEIIKRQTFMEQVNPRWPIGRARNMCSRCNFTHFLDYDGLGGIENPKRPLANADAELCMQCISDPREFDSNLEKVDLYLEK